jgi:hypothetical protein
MLGKTFQFSLRPLGGNWRILAQVRVRIPSEGVFCRQIGHSAENTLFENSDGFAKNLVRRGPGPLEKYAPTAP